MEAPHAVVAHGTEADPLFFYGNRTALALFAMRAADFIGLPSHRSAEPALRDERAAMLARLERDQIVDDYAGVRIAASGRRFAIGPAHVWNLVEERGRASGKRRRSRSGASSTVSRARARPVPRAGRGCAGW